MFLNAGSDIGGSEKSRSSGVETTGDISSYLMTCSSSLRFSKV